MNKKTLVILTPAFPADNSNAESVWIPAKRRLIKSFNRNYPEIEIVILSFQFPLCKKKYFFDDNLIIPFAGANKSKRKNWLIWINVFLELRKLKKERNIIGLLSFWCAECAFVAHYFCKIYKLKHLCWISGQDARLENKFVKRIHPNPQELVAMSDFLMIEFYKNHKIRPAHLISNAIDRSQFTFKNNPRNIDIIGVGGLSPLKQYDIFVDIIYELKKSFPNIRVYLCGNGSEKENIKLQIARLNLEENIVLTGTISQEEVFDIMQQSKILLHTSNYEGFGNVCIEALYAGAQVVSFIKPMQQEINQWHIVKAVNEMTAKASQLLSDNYLTHDSILPFDMDNSAKEFMQLFL